MCCSPVRLDLVCALTLYETCESSPENNPHLYLFSLPILADKASQAFKEHPFNAHADLGNQYSQVALRGMGVYPSAF